MRASRVCLGFVIFTSAAAIANARVLDEHATSPKAAVSQPTPLVRRPARTKLALDTTRELEGHVHIVIAPLVVAPADRNDPWSGGPMAVDRSFFAPLDTTDPWNGRRIALRSNAQIDATDPWK